MSQLDCLKEYLGTLVPEGICIGFSGGVDSSLLLKAAAECASHFTNHIYAVTFQTKLHAVSDMLEAEKAAKQFGVQFVKIEVNEFENPHIRNNSKDRCYYCKKMLFEKLIQFAEEVQCKYVLDGSNEDDLNEYRPGRKALKELGVISPFIDLHITKSMIREMAEGLKISAAHKPAAPCMATRIPYDTELDYELLERIQKGEELIKAMGFYNVRLRIHGENARLEIDTTDFGYALEKRAAIINGLKALNFRYVTLDLEGFRSGSMDQ